MAQWAEEMHDPVVVEIDDHFTRLPHEERERLKAEWLASLHTDAPLQLSVTGRGWWLKLETNPGGEPDHRCLSRLELLLGTVAGHSLLDQMPSRADWWFLSTTTSRSRSRSDVLRTTITPAQGIAAFDRLQRGRLHRAQVRPLLEQAWSRRGHLTVADAVYVVLEEQIEATLVTGDRNLARSPGLKFEPLTP